MRNQRITNPSRIYELRTLGAVALLLVLLTAAPLPLNAQQTCRSDAGGYCINLAQISQTAQVPGLEFLPIPQDAGIGDILSAIYVFGVGFVGISALLVLVFAGIWYMTAGDSQQKTGQARTWAGNAIFGLVLALLSWLILYTINPDFVQKLELTLPELSTQPAPGS